MKKKNIGIFTFHRAHNYGALLQAYALQELLSEKYNPFFVDYYNLKIYGGYKIIRPLGKNFLKWPVRLFNDIKQITIRKERYDVFEKFISDNLKIKKYDINCLNDCDVLITGSDQVWNPLITGSLLNEYTLYFPNNTSKKIAYAASCGFDENIIKYANDFKLKLSKIDEISIREESCKNKLSEIIPDKKIQTVLDPTLLLNMRQWEEKIVDLNLQKTDKYIFAYVVAPNDEYMKIVNELSKKTGFKVMTTSAFKMYDNQIINDKFYNPLEFIKLIKNSEYVVTTSFHATVFSIIFNKKFWVVPHKTTGSRVTDLLKKLCISNRAVNSLEEFKKLDFDEDIDYENVNKILEKEREKSINWLIDAIEK